MSQKQTVIDLYEAGKDYDSIEKETGAKRTYIRTIISQYKKTLDAGGVGDQTGEPEAGDPPEGSEVNNEGMDFTNDLNGENNSGGDNMEDQKTGAEHHKAWVEAKAYECACGCTLNRRSKFCPNCGITLDWSGF